MRERTIVMAHDCLSFGLQLEMKADFIHEQGVRVTHTYEFDRSKEGIA
jgi:hypothetical protein